MNLASHITHWPENATHAVVKGGEISFTKGGAPVWNDLGWTILGNAGADVFWISDVGKKMGEEWRKESYIVTRAQWEAERARIASNKPNAEPESVNRTQYEQELWDKVAVAAMQSLTSSYWESQDAFEDAKALVKCQCESACEYADAFMAERAKRLKGVK